MTQSLLHVPCDRASWVAVGHPGRSTHVSFSLRIPPCAVLLTGKPVYSPRAPLRGSNPSSVFLLLGRALLAVQGEAGTDLCRPWIQNRLGLGLSLNDVCVWGGGS